MKLTKFVLCSLAAALFAASACLAQSAEFSAHMKKAKEYESQKKWTFALGEYYDALGTDDEIEIRDEAFMAYKSLTDVILSGMPGYGEYDDFSLVDNWILLLQDFERYWTEHCPLLILCGRPERVSLNRENRTASYDVKISWKLLPKCEEIQNVVKQGLKKAYSEDWKLPYLESWPNASVYNSEKDKNKFLQNGAALTQCLLSVENIAFTSNLESETWTSYIYSKYKIPASLALFGCIEKMLDGVYRPGKETTLFDLKLKIIDDSGNVIFDGGRLLVGPDAKYNFTASQAQMKLIDEGKYSFVVNSLFLEYGNISTKTWITKNSRDWVKPLPEIEVAVKNVVCVSEEKVSKYNKSLIDEFNERLRVARNIEEKKVREEQLAEKRKKDVERRNQEIAAQYNHNLNEFYKFLALAQEDVPYKKYCVKPIAVEEINNRERGYYNFLLSDAVKKYGSKKFDLAISYVRCNAISNFCHLPAVYRIPEHVSSYEKYAEEVAYYLENFDRIQVDINAAGYRVPEEKETRSFSSFLTTDLISIVRKK